MKTMMTAGAALLMSTSIAAAGGIDRSGQGLGAIFEDTGETGSYFQVSFGYADPAANNAAMSDPLDAYTSLAFAYKHDFTDQTSFTIIVDEPFGVNVEYVDGPFAGGRAHIDSSALTGVLRHKFNDNFSVHGGLRAQSLSGEVASVALLQAESGYDLGYLVGAAYERPDIALRVALTYNSEITNTLSGTENFAPIADFDVVTPASLNLEFQTGIAADTLLFGSIRHAYWDGFTLATAANDYVEFSGDTTTYSVGIGRRLNDSLSVFGTIGYEEPGDRPGTTPLAPTTGTTSIGIGATYAMDENTSITAGASYVRLGDQSVGPFNFEDNSAIGFGVRMGYTF